MSNRRQAILGFGIGLVLLSIIFYVFRSSPRPPAPSVVAQPLPSATPPPPFEPSAATQRPAEQKLSLGLRQGDRLMYEFFQQRSIKVAANAAITSTTPSSDIMVKQMGKFIVNVYAEDYKGWTVGFQLMDGHIESPIIRTDNLSDEMGREIMALILKSGRIHKLVTPNEMSPDARNHWRDILSRWQVILPNDIQETKWTRTEEDSTGIYVTNYNRVNLDPEYNILKRKDHYLSISSMGQKGSFTARSSVQGEALIRMAPYQQSIEGSESFSVKNIGSMPSVDSQATFTFHLRSVSQENAVISARQQKMVEVSSATNVFSWTGEIVPAAQDESAGNAVTREMVEAELAALKELLATGPAGTAEHVKSMERLHTLIRSDDLAVDVIFDRLNDKLSTSDYASTLIGMLGAAGTPAAQSVLLAIATTAAWPAEQREMAIFSFVQVTEPIPQIDGWMVEIHAEGKEYANNALLIMAAIGDRLRTTNPTRFNSISQYVLAYADTIGLDDNQAIVALDAIGNLGPLDMPQLVQEAIRSEDTIIRQSAVQSLQRIFHEKASTLITQAILNDPSDGVRASAAKLLADTNRSGAVGILGQVIANDKSDEVRKESIASLDAWYGKNPEVARILTYIVEHDASEDVRVLAHQLLESHAVDEGQ